MASTKNTVLYLNHPNTPYFDSTFVRLLGESKQNKAPVEQWVGQIKGMAQKGLKMSELDEIGFMEALEALGSKEVLTKDELKGLFLKMQPTVKEVTLAVPKFKAHHHVLENEVRYFEILYILNSESANIDDRILAIEEELEEVNFRPEMLSEDPELVIRLTKEREALMVKAPTAYDFKHHHYSTVIDDNMGKNLLAHARCMLTKDGTWAIQEIQSDWAQHGRRANWSAAFPRGPFVTDTERWAGLVIRRLIQRAALTLPIKRVVWMRSWMRNGNLSNRSQQEAPPAGVEDNRQDKLDDFYAKTLPKIVNKITAKSDVKCGFFDLVGARGELKDCIGFEFNDKLREAMKKTQPLYSLAGVYSRPQPVDPDRLAFLKRHARVMTGARSIQFLDKLYDISTGNMVAGRVFNRMIEVALNAKDIESAVNHESFHYVHEHLLTGEERRLVRLDFGVGTDLHERVVSALARKGDLKAAMQCERPDECAAHGFALWMKNELSLERRPSRSLFESIGRTLKDVVSWVHRVALNQPVQTPEDLYAAVRDGIFAADAARSPEVLQSPRSDLTPDGRPLEVVERPRAV